jgi:competence protein ComEC
MVLDLGGDAFLFVLYPDKDVSRLADTDANEASIIARLVYGEASVLLTGDAPKFVEYHLTQLDGAALRSDILKVGHHGSRTSTSDILLQYAQPALAVISVAKNSRYGHPHKEVLDTLARFNIPFLRTDEEGTVVFVSDGEAFQKK